MPVAVRDEVHPRDGASVAAAFPQAPDDGALERLRTGLAVRGAPVRADHREPAGPGGPRPVTSRGRHAAGSSTGLFAGLRPAARTSHRSARAAGAARHAASRHGARLNGRRAGTEGEFPGQPNPAGGHSRWLLVGAGGVAAFVLGITVLVASTLGSTVATAFVKVNRSPTLATVDLTTNALAQDRLTVTPSALSVRLTAAIGDRRGRRQLRARLVLDGLPLVSLPVDVQARPAAALTAAWRVIGRPLTGRSGTAVLALPANGDLAYRVSWAATHEAVRRGLAHAILDDRRIALTGAYVRTDLLDSAKGLPGSSGHLVSTAILRLILAVGRRHPVVVSAVESGGNGHCDQGYGPEPESVCPNDPHYRGDAVDFAALGNVALTGRDAGSLLIIRIAETLLPGGSGFGQSECGATPPLPRGWTTFPDVCDHLHVQVPAGTP
jgi:hypothetical protein